MSIFGGVPIGIVVLVAGEVESGWAYQLIQLKL